MNSLAGQEVSCSFLLFPHQPFLRMNSFTGVSIAYKSWRTCFKSLELLWLPLSTIVTLIALLSSMLLTAILLRIPWFNGLLVPTVVKGELVILFFYLARRPHFVMIPKTCYRHSSNLIPMWNLSFTQVSALSDLVQTFFLLNITAVLCVFSD